MDRSELETLLDAKINPLVETIKRLEQSQEKMVEVMMDQARMNESLMHLQKSVEDHIKGSTLIHNELFSRLRESEKNSECKVIHNELSERIDDMQDKQEDKLWDVTKLLVAGATGGFISWVIKRL